ncbi:MAG: hypothetical protein AUI14_23520 [Actinobacteria bacterium 13_2_20CM_2_71_6]|nr:MAG: hypothetical protein AUI14_23520 [Actinobacteria bacterium 13_2_20CM_2_71_6]
MASPEPGSTGGPAPHAPPGQVALDQPIEPDALYTLRAAVAAHASATGLPLRQVEHLVIIASELATNASRYARGGRLRLWRDGNRVYCQVSDEGPGLPDPDQAAASAPPASAPNGRGLWICRQLADDLEITSGPTGTSVTAAMDLPVQ